MDKFNPQDYLLGELQKVVANKKDVIISHDDYGVLTVLTESGEYYSNVSDMKGLCGTTPIKLDVRELTNNESIDCSLGNEFGRNLDELMWQAGHYASEGRLMEGLNLDDVVKMKHWPNLTRLPSNVNTFQIAAMLTRHPTTIMFVQRVLKIPQNEINVFYTAGYCAGLAQILNGPPDVMPIKEETSEGTLLSRIIGRIASL